MSKEIEPYKAVYNVNGEILYSTTNIAYHLGRLSVLDSHVYDEKDTLRNLKSLCELLNIEATASQFKGLTYGDSVEKKPQLLKLYQLYASITRMDPYDYSSIKKVEEAFFPFGVPNRLSRKLDDFPYPLPMHKKIEALTKGLFRFSKGNLKSMNPITIGCAFCFVFQAIAPYSSCNLPIALFYFHAYLSSYSKSLASMNLFKIYLSHKEEIEASYAKSVEQGEMGPYLLCWMKLLDIGVNALLSKAVRGNGKVTSSVTKLLSRMEPNHYYSALELCQLLGLKSRLGLQKNYLRPGLEAKVLFMSNPLVPTDRNQRYYKKGE